MNTTLSIFIALIAVAFYFYGYNCLFDKRLFDEFSRFGLTAVQRRITGVAQIVGASGLLIGLWYLPLGFYASLGLCVLMICGFAVRLKIKDNFVEAAPSFILVLVNGYFLYRFGLALGYWFIP